MWVSPISSPPTFRAKIGIFSKVERSWYKGHIAVFHLKLTHRWQRPQFQLPGAQCLSRTEYQHHFGVQWAFRCCCLVNIYVKKVCQSAPKHTAGRLKTKKKFLGRWHSPLRRPLPTGEGTPLPRPHPFGACGLTLCLASCIRCSSVKSGRPLLGCFRHLWYKGNEHRQFSLFYQVYWLNSVYFCCFVHIFMLYHVCLDTPQHVPSCWSRSKLHLNSSVMTNILPLKSLSESARYTWHIFVLIVWLVDVNRPLLCAVSRPIALSLQWLSGVTVVCQTYIREVVGLITGQVVSTRMGDCPWTGKPYRYITNHPGRLPECLAGVKVGHIYSCRVTVWFHMAGEAP